MSDDHTGDLFGATPPLLTNPSTIPAPFVRDSATSQAAAAAIEPTAGTLRAEVLAFIRGRKGYGATDAEIQDALGMRPQTQTPRRIELRDRVLIVDSGVRRATPRGRQATVWVAPEYVKP